MKKNRGMLGYVAIGWCAMLKIGLCLSLLLVLCAAEARTESSMQFESVPERVVSLVPGVTDMIFAIGAGTSMAGMTLYDADFHHNDNAQLVGGFFSPSVAKIQSLKPDVIFLSDLHQGVQKAFQSSECRLIRLETKSIEDIFRHLELIGGIFHRQSEAEAVIEQMQTQITRIQQKIGLMPESAGKRVIRVMGIDPLTVPGDDSFQLDFIRAAGGIPPVLGRLGQVTKISPEEWNKFRPDVVYYCGLDRGIIQDFLNKPEWREVPAVQQGALLDFPCNLACRASVGAGNFIEWLAARIYPEHFADPKQQISENKIINTVLFELELDYVKQSGIVTSHILDFLHKTLVIELKEPMEILSSLEGWRTGILQIGNSYGPPPVWGLYHQIGLEESKKMLHNTLRADLNSAGFLFTGADMDLMSVVKQTYQDMSVYALVTAGVKSNAMRMSRDAGLYYELGTINIIILSNMQLSRRAMSRAVITATEAKTAALQDLDIRSSYTGVNHAATGTGTDNVIIVQGTGMPIDHTGGHTKMGELMAAAVYQAVREAVFSQNRIAPDRNIFRRLQERGISLYSLFDPQKCGCQFNPHQLAAAMEKLLLEPAYRGFLENAFSLSDHYERGLVSDLSWFEQQCQTVTRAAAGNTETDNPPELIMQELPRVLKTALEALAQGAYHQLGVP